MACIAFASSHKKFLDTVLGLKYKSGPQIRVSFLFLNQNICCGYSKEPSRGGSFEHRKHMFKLMDKKIIVILH